MNRRKWFLIASALATLSVLIQGCETLSICTYSNTRLIETETLKSGSYLVFGGDQSWVAKFYRTETQGRVHGLFPSFGSEKFYTEHIEFFDLGEVTGFVSRPAPVEAQHAVVLDDDSQTQLEMFEKITIRPWRFGVVEKYQDSALMCIFDSNAVEDWCRSRKVHVLSGSADNPAQVRKKESGKDGGLLGIFKKGDTRTDKHETLFSMAGQGVDGGGGGVILVLNPHELDQLAIDLYKQNALIPILIVRQTEGTKDLVSSLQAVTDNDFGDGDLSDQLENELRKLDPKLLSRYTELLDRLN